VIVVSVVSDLPELPQEIMLHAIARSIKYLNTFFILIIL